MRSQLPIKDLGYTYKATAYRIASSNAGRDFWPARDFNRFVKACKRSGLDPEMVVDETEAAHYGIEL